MNKLTQFDSLVIHEFEEEKFHLPAHGHTYYELIYILKGQGNHHINNNNLSYKAGDLFLISPDDEHYFEIKKNTRFVFIKFTDSYFNRQGNLLADDLLLLRPESIMRHKLLKEMNLEFDEPCRTILKNTITNIVLYNCRKDITTSPLMYYHILALFGLIKEAVVKRDIRINNDVPDKDTLISYIHEHIYQPEATLIKSIAAYFNISDNYFSAYFKRKFGMSYRNYLNNYRIKLIQQRIAGGQMPLKQIAAEFGFTDESHLSNYFKKQTASSPNAYKKSYRNEYLAQA